MAVPRLFTLCCCLAAGACALPEDVFVLEGALSDGDGAALPAATVRLLRDASPDLFRCAPTHEVSRATTDARGGYRFELIRQQVTLGGAPRVFRVESTHSSGHTASFTFRFPDADLRLPPLPVAASARVVPGLFPRVGLPEREAFLDGALAWRGPFAQYPPLEGRDAVARVVRRQSTLLAVDTNALGSTQEVPVSVRFEEPLEPVSRYGAAPLSRGVPCNVAPEGDACPLTDGRFQPVRLPEDTRAIVLTFPRDEQVRRLWLRGLVVEGAFTTVKLEWSFDPNERWASFKTVTVGDVAGALPWACDEPGLFLGPLDVSVGPVPKPRQLRLRFLDDAEDTKPVSWLSEVSVE